MPKNEKVKSDLNNLFFENQILRVEQVAKLLSFSKWHIYRLVNQKKLPYYKKGKTLFFMSQDILEWVQKGAA